jgi:hypothetical protein
MSREKYSLLGSVPDHVPLSRFHAAVTTKAKDERDTGSCLKRVPGNAAVRSARKENGNSRGNLEQKLLKALPQSVGQAVPCALKKRGVKEQLRFFRAHD